MAKLQGPRNQQVVLAGDEVGSCLAIHLSQDPRSVFAWTLRVQVRTEGKGAYTLGRAIAMPAFDPGAAPPPQGFPKLNDAGRVVAMAYCPGAIAWTVDAVPFIPFHLKDPIGLESAVCELQLSSDMIAGGIDEPGVITINSDGRGPTWIPKSFVKPVPLVDQWQIGQFPSYLWKIEGVGAGAPAGGLFLQVFDETVAVANGAQPLWSIVGEPIAGVAGAVRFLQQWPRGIFTRRGLRLATSSTYPVLTLAGTFSASSEIEIVPAFAGLP